MKKSDEERTCKTCAFDINKYCVRIRFPIYDENINDGCPKYIKKNAPENPWLM